ncbi:MAG: DUF3047 domain-containing protein [Burkholderiales bacterium]
MPKTFRFGPPALAFACALLLAACSSGPDRGAAIKPRGEPQVVVMDFSQPLSLDPLPPGWQHRTFWTRAPMQMSFGVKDGVPAIRLETDASASMLMRAVAIDLQAYPILAWRWLIERPIESDVDERTKAGDDHPARLIISFRTEAGEKRSMEIVWGNKLLGAGDYKFIDGFPHYVANGGAANVGRWHSEQVDLLAIYRHIWKDAAPASVTDIGLFCDSDETGGSTVAWFADVRMKQKP